MHKKHKKGRIKLGKSHIVILNALCYNKTKGAIPNFLLEVIL